MSVYYAIYRGRFGSHVYLDWDTAKVAMNGFPDARVKKFEDQDAARQFCKDGLAQQQIPAPRDDTIDVWTDGSSVNQRTVGGIGVYFGENSPLNVSERVAFQPCTNQQAELLAATRGLQQIRCHSGWPPSRTRIRVNTDSKYTIGCAVEWRAAWERTNFRDNTIKNRAIIEALWREIDTAPFPAEFFWVRGHGSCKGNIQADKFATNAK